MAEFRTGRLQESLGTLDDADRIQLKARGKRNYVDVLFRAMALHRLGRLEEAREALDQARSLIGEHKDALTSEDRTLLREAEEQIGDHA